MTRWHLAALIAVLVSGSPSTSRAGEETVRGRELDRADVVAQRRGRKSDGGTPVQPAGDLGRSRRSSKHKRPGTLSVDLASRRIIDRFDAPSELTVVTRAQRVELRLRWRKRARPDVKIIGRIDPAEPNRLHIESIEGRGLPETDAKIAELRREGDEIVGFRMDGFHEGKRTVKRGTVGFSPGPVGEQPGGGAAAEARPGATLLERSRIRKGARTEYSWVFSVPQDDGKLARVAVVGMFDARSNVLGEVAVYPLKRDLSIYQDAYRKRFEAGVPGVRAILRQLRATLAEDGYHHVSLEGFRYTGANPGRTIKTALPEGE